MTQVERIVTPFQAQAASLALVRMFSAERHFSICTIDTVAKVLGRSVGGPDYDALRALHCIDWHDMPEAMRTQVKEKTFELLGLPPVIIDQPPEPNIPNCGTSDDEEKRKRSPLLRLLGLRA